MARKPPLPANYVHLLTNFLVFDIIEFLATIFDIILSTPRINSVLKCKSAWRYLT